MNETGYDSVAHKHYRHRVINIVRIDSKLTGYEYFAKRDRKLKGIVIFRRNSDFFLLDPSPDRGISIFYSLIDRAYRTHCEFSNLLFALLAIHFYRTHRVAL